MYVCMYVCMYGWMDVYVDQIKKTMCSQTHWLYRYIHINILEHNKDAKMKKSELSQCLTFRNSIPYYRICISFATCFMDERKVHNLTNKPSKSSSKLVLGNCVGRRFALGVALRYESCKTVKVSSFGCK